MSLFDKQHKKEPLVTNQDKRFTGSAIARDLTQNVAICMTSLGITTMPTLSYFYNDNGIFEGVYISHMNDPQVDSVRELYGNDAYLRLLGCHALGAGVYVTISQHKYKKPVDEFTFSEAKEINNAFREIDPYELAIRSLGFGMDSGNKKCMDNIVTVAIETYKNSVGNSILNKAYLKDYMQVLYNAGITIILGK